VNDIEKIIDNEIFEKTLEEIIKERQQFEEQLKKQINESENKNQFIPVITEKIPENKITFTQVPAYNPYG
jgi:hypothetical protein